MKPAGKYGKTKQKQDIFNSLYIKNKSTMRDGTKLLHYRCPVLMTPRILESLIELLKGCFL